jgi:hypothetical protein
MGALQRAVQFIMQCTTGAAPGTQMGDDKCGQGRQALPTDLWQIVHRPAPDADLANPPSGSLSVADVPCTRP